MGSNLDSYLIILLFKHEILNIISSWILKSLLFLGISPLWTIVQLWSRRQNSSESYFSCQTKKIRYSYLNPISLFKYKTLVGEIYDYQNNWRQSTSLAKIELQGCSWLFFLSNGWRKKKENIWMIKERDLKSFMPVPLILIKWLLFAECLLERKLEEIKKIDEKKKQMQM